jgi:L-phenylalanine/L-methionine N-acetyltransferase
MLRPARNTDFNTIFDLYMHPEINPFLLYENLSQAEFKPIFQDLLNDEVLYVFEIDSQAVGMIKLIRLKHRCHHIAYLGGVAINPQYGGSGHGKAMLNAVLTLAKGMGLLRIELSTATSNHKAIGLYESLGFEKEGTLRKYTYLKSEGRFLDEVMMSYLIDQN